MRTMAILAAILTIAGFVYAAEGTATGPAVAKDVAVTATMKAVGTIDKVDAAKSEITVKEAVKSVTVSVEAETLIKVDGKAAKIDALKAGQKGTVEYKEAVAKKSAVSIDVKNIALVIPAAPAPKPAVPAKAPAVEKKI